MGLKRWDTTNRMGSTTLPQINGGAWPLSVRRHFKIQMGTTTRARGSARAAHKEDEMEDFSAAESERIRSSLLHWYDGNRRVLPWRRRAKESSSSSDQAYAVWVSEVMLQQTRVHTVIDYYNRWMNRWPTIQHLASASQEEVNEMWAGLGYYRRARFLLEGAKSIVEQGEFPPTESALRGVRGIGKYTAGAIASIAFNEPVPVVDGNVIRVITRLKAISANPKETATINAIWKLAGQLVDPARPGDFNQAMMELGATLCSTSSPGCVSCPVSTMCRALSLSEMGKSVKVTDYPTKVPKANKRHDFAAVCVVEIAADGLKLEEKFLLVKRPEEGLLAGLWEFPSVLLEEENTDIETRRNSMDHYLKGLFGISVEDCDVIFREDVGEYVHVFSHIRLRMYVELLTLSPKGINLVENQSSASWKCVDGSSLRSMGLTSGVRKVYNMIQDLKQKKLKNASKKRTKRSIHSLS